MANPTTNFGWVMPTSTSLVTNLPADFNTFGQAVDTSMSELLGGTTGQVLSKTSNTNMDFTWVTPTDQTPLTTKGDIFAFSTVDARLPAGTNETRLVADSTQTLGLKYVADTTNYAIAAKGDLLAGTAADTLQALSVGTNGQTLVADSTASTGLKWATPASGGKVLQVVFASTATQATSSSSTYADTGLTATITPTLATSKILVVLTQQSVAKSGSTEVKLQLLRGATTILKMGDLNGYTSSADFNAIGSVSASYLDSPATTSATTYKTQFASGQNITTCFVQAYLSDSSSSVSTITLMEIGA
jgi:hypothetical protein